MYANKNVYDTLAHSIYKSSGAAFSFKGGRSQACETSRFSLSSVHGIVKCLNIIIFSLALPAEDLLLLLD